MKKTNIRIDSEYCKKMNKIRKDHNPNYKSFYNHLSSSLKQSKKRNENLYFKIKNNQEKNSKYKISLQNQILNENYFSQNYNNSTPNKSNHHDENTTYNFDNNEGYLNKNNPNLID
jgi:hypothetical protein